MRKAGKGNGSKGRLPTEIDDKEDNLMKLDEIKQRMRDHGPTTALAGSRSYVDLSVLKKAQDLLGLAGGRKVRKPITEIDSQDEEELRRILKALGLPLAK